MSNHFWQTVIMTHITLFHVDMVCATCGSESNTHFFLSNHILCTYSLTSLIVILQCCCIRYIPTILYWEICMITAFDLHLLYICKAIWGFGLICNGPVGRLLWRQKKKQLFTEENLSGVKMPW